MVTPRVAASWNTFGQVGTLKGSYSTAFRAPSWDETDNSTSRRIQANALKPEKVQSFDVNVEHHIGAHRLVLGGFYSHWDNLVELAPLSDAEAIDAIRNGKTKVPFTPGIQLTQYRNTTDVKNYGLNTGVEGARFGPLHVWRLGHRCDRRKANRANLDRLPVAPQLFGNARLAFVLTDPLPTVGLGVRFIGPRPADLSSGFEPPPYARAGAEFKLTLSGIAPVIKGLSYRMIFDYNTAKYGPYVVGPVTGSIPTQPTANLNPVDQFRATAGLQYEF